MILPSIACWQDTFGQDVAESILSSRSWTMWMLGYPDAALADADRALSVANEVNHAATIMYALGHAPFPLFHCGDTQRRMRLLKSSLLWRTRKAAYCGSHRSIERGLRRGPQWSSFESSATNYGSNHCVRRLHRSNVADATVVVAFGFGIRTTRPSSMMLGAVSAKRWRDGDDRRKRGANLKSIALLAKSR